MGDFSKAVDKMFEYRDRIIVLGLTGRTGSGCTTVAGILSRESFDCLDLRRPKTYDYIDAEKRKQEIIFSYMQEKHWKPFYVIEGSAIILSFVFERGYDELIAYLKSNNE